MGSRLPPYPDCRDSGLAWLPRVPSHWDVRRLKYVFREVVDRTDTGEEVLLSLRQFLRLVPHKDVSKKPIEAADIIGFKRVYAGQFVLNRMRASSGMMAFSARDGLVSPDYATFQPLCPADPRFIVYLMQTRDLGSEFRRQSKGLGTGSSGFLRLYTDRFGATAIPFPPIDEQSRIADYLDAHGRLTNRLIRNRRSLIASLQKRNHAIIIAAVTRGLDPSKPMKATGITTLPQVPLHWDICLLKRMAMLQRGYDLPEDQRQPGPYPVVSSAGPIGFHSLAKAAAPGVVTGRYGSTGKIHFIEHDFWPHNTSLFVVNFFGNLPRFIYYLLQTVSTEEHAIKAAVPGIDRKDLHETLVAAVPLNEQAAIVVYLDAVALETHTVVERTERHIELLRAYRERLIADLVTGARDIRHAPLPLPPQPGIDDDESPEIDEGDETEGVDAESELAEVDE
jgi:type I restriction enzyme S subunit